MGFGESLDSVMDRIAGSDAAETPLVRRITAEIAFVRGFAELHPAKKEEWQGLILAAVELVSERLSGDLAGAVAEAESLMSGIGEAAKEYTVHCIGHAHIDMDWSWPWIETITMSHDTFVTVDRLMDEFPEFKFCQSQVSVYKAMEDYFPEVFEMIRRRIKEGRWEVTASMWVEGDKNMASGESLCRHALYSKRYFKERFGLPYDAVKIDWEGDTFGHAHTLPAILTRGGVTRYYHCRTGPEKWLLWWRAPDGSRVLRFMDRHWYGGQVTTDLAAHMLDYVKETGLKDFGFVYGVGDHGGGPTRRDLVLATEMASWPVFPTVRLSTTDAFFTAVEKANADLPVHDGELNYVFEGCYTSQSKAKLINRIGETVLPEVETVALVAGAAVGLPYPREQMRKAWECVMFNQFHDILAGSSEHEAMEEAVARFREAEAIAGAVRMRALRKVASEVNTSTAPGVKAAGEAGPGDSIGFGAGDFGVPGGVSTLSLGSADVEPVVVFNALPFPRSEMVAMKVWGKDWPADRIAVRDDSGRVTAGQVIGRSQYGSHESIVVLFPALDVPATGYKTFTVECGMRNAECGDRGGAVLLSPAGGSSSVMENEHIRVEVDIASGAIRHLTDKATGYDLVPEGELMGVLELCQEAPHEMSGWDIGKVESVTRFTDGAKIDESERQPFLDGSKGLGMVNPSQFAQAGPHRAAVRTTRMVGKSRVTTEVALSAGSAAVEVTVIAQWKEMGTPQTGVPMLRIAFPAKVVEPRATYEIPFGSIVRPANGQEVPALRWADLSGNRVGAAGACGITVLNDCKYGHSADGSTLRVTLLRSSYDPDPVPEMGSHTIRFLALPHDGPCPVSAATRAGAAFNLPMSVVNTDIHGGTLPLSKGFVEIMTPNVMLAALKRAEDSDAVIVRLHEMEGKETEARLRIAEIVKPGAAAREVDLMEQPLEANTARMAGEVLAVRIPAHGIASVAVG
jgi:alpha-mannosidase